MNTITSITIFCSFAGVLIAAGIISKAGAATEQPDFTIVLAEGEIEVREYAAMQIVTVPMDGSPAVTGEKDEKEKGHSSFMTLFRYVKGANEDERKIPMTAPVLIDATSSESRTMSFILPREVARAGAPLPTNDAVEVQEVGRRRYAALRFKGYRSKEAEQEAPAEIQAWLEKRNLQAEGGPLFAYYNAPWTPEFMRRNEVLFRLTDNSTSTRE